MLTCGHCHIIYSSHHRVLAVCIHMPVIVTHITSDHVCIDDIISLITAHIIYCHNTRSGIMAAASTTTNTTTSGVMSTASMEAASEWWPVRYWGLDPLYLAHVKLCIKQFHSLPSYPELAGTARLYTHPILNVEIMGYVIGMEVKANMSLYTIDDGTGVVTCKLWHSKDVRDHDDDNQPAAVTAFIDTNAVNHARSGNSHRLSVTAAAAGVTANSIRFGYLVSIHGKLDQYRGERQINIRTWRVEVILTYSFV